MICEPCPYKTIIDPINKNACISCPQDNPFFNRSTIKCGQCPKGQHVNFTDISSCVTCPKDNPFYNITIDKCEACEWDARYNSDTLQC